MDAIEVYTIRYRINGEWKLSPWKMPVEYAEKQYDMTQWEIVPESREIREPRIGDSKYGSMSDMERRR